MAIRLGLTTKRSKEQIKWSDTEIEILKEHYPDMGKDVTRLLPGRTAATCCRIASELGLSIRGDYWSEEDAILREYYPREGKKVSQRLPNRGETSCDSRARKLGLYRMKSMDDHISQADAASEAVQPAKAEAEAQSVEEADEEQPEEHTIGQFGMTHM